MAKGKAPEKTGKQAVKKTTKLGGRPTKKGSTGNREYGFMLFMQRVLQNEIAERCGVSIQTISEWKKTDNWEAKRASKTISMDTLINKALDKINIMLDQDDFNADAFAKAVAQLKTLKIRNTVDDEVMCFMDFQNFMLERRHTEGLTEDFIKQVIRVQDTYIQYRLGN
jgi:hypothetical protein